MRLFATVFLTVLLISAVASAQPVQWPVSEGGNGHSYEYVAAPNIDWETASLDAVVWNAALSAWGHLLTIESAEENAWVLANVATVQDAWIGLSQSLSQPPLAPCSFEPDLGWWWITTRPFVYTNWCAGQPDDGGTTQCDFVPHQQHGMFAAGGCWTDEFAANVPVTGYLVEYDPSLVSVEESLWGNIKSLYK